MTLVAPSAGWLADVVGQVSSVSIPLLVVALAPQTGQTPLNAAAWRNVLCSAYPEARPTYPQVLGAYAGGVGLNVVLPAQGGSVAMLVLYRRRIQGSTVLGLVGAALVQSLVFVVVGICVGIGLLASRPGTFHVKLAWLHDHPALALVAVLAVVVGAPVAWVRIRARLSALTEGGAICARRAVRRVAAGARAPWSVDGCADTASDETAVS